MSELPSVKNDPRSLAQLKELVLQHDIPDLWQGSPIEAFILAQNFGVPVQTTGKPELLISTCIEFRYALPVPRQYAYVIRRASGRVIGSEFSVGYTLAKGVKHLVMIGHNDCGMSKLPEMGPKVVDAFVDQGWSRRAAEAYVAKHAERHAIGDELEALKEEYLRLKALFPKLVIAPLFVNLNDGKLYLPTWHADVPQATAVSDEYIAGLP